MDSLPQIVVGLGETHQGIDERWLKTPKVAIPGEPGLASYIMDRTVGAGFQSAMSYKVKADHGFMAVYRELDPMVQLPMVPIVMNCTTPPLMTVRRCYEFGKAVGDAIRGYPGLKRVALCATGGLSHYVAEPRVGEIEEDFDRWFVRQLEQTDLSDLLDISNDELITGQRHRSGTRWIAVAGAMHGHPGITLPYEPVYEWIKGWAL